MTSICAANSKTLSVPTVNWLVHKFSYIIIHTLSFSPFLLCVQPCTRLSFLFAIDLRFFVFVFFFSSKKTWFCIWTQIRKAKKETNKHLLPFVLLFSHMATKYAQLTWRILLLLHFFVDLLIYKEKRSICILFTHNMPCCRLFYCRRCRCGRFPFFNATCMYLSI